MFIIKSKLNILDPYKNIYICRSFDWFLPDLKIKINMYVNLWPWRWRPRKRKYEIGGRKNSDLKIKQVFHDLKFLSGGRGGEDNENSAVKRGHGYLLLLFYLCLPWNSSRDFFFPFHDFSSRFTRFAIVGNVVH